MPCGCVLLDCNQDWHATTFAVLATDQVTWALRRYQDYINALRRFDVAVANVEAMAEEQRVARYQVGFNRRAINLALCRIRRQHHDQVRLFAGFVRRQHAKSLSLGLLTALAALREPDAYVNTGVA